MATIALASCNTKPAEADLVVLFTTDVHGACLAHDIKNNAPAQTSLANVSTYLNQVRKENSGKVLLFDTGDFLQGQPSLYYYNFIDTVDEHVAAATYNYLQYDALGVGNHDIETGEEVYNNRFPKQLKMPWLCANAIDTRTGKPMFQPYAVFERQGVKVAVLGMITPHIGAWLPKELWSNLEFEDMVDCAKKWVPVIQEKERPDLLIGLFHAGTDYTINGNDMNTRFNENGSIPAVVKVQGFDLCLLGHDHNPQLRRVQNLAEESVYIIDAGTQARKVGRADIHLTLQEDGKYKKQIKTQLVDMKEYAPDSAYVAAFQKYVDATNNYVDDPIGKLTGNLSGMDGLVGPSAFIDLVHDAQLWATKADISLTTLLSPYEEVAAGDITMRHLFILYKYENLLYTIQMKADEVRKYLEHGYAMQYGTMKSANDHLMNFKPYKEGDRPQLAGITFNFTSAAGIKYVVDVTKEPGNRVRLISMSDGSPIDPDKLYTVAINSYQYSGGGNFIPEGLGWDSKMLKSRTLTTSNIDVRRYLEKNIREKGTITPHVRGDWSVEPKKWYEAARKRDLLLLQNKSIYH
jgi:2',3'-cyclic-nucleotide 2'-phosphodiesterase/3'-nucleotidase